MKPYITVLAPLLLMLTVADRVGAQDCRYEKNEVDKFTGEKTILTAPTTVVTKNVKVKKTYIISKIDMQLKAAEGGRSVVFIPYFSLGLSMANTNDKAIVLLSNGERVELPCLQNIPDTRYQGVGMGTAVMAFEFGISEEAFAKLCGANMTDVRIAASMNPVDFTMMEGVSTASMFQCIK